MRTAIWRSGAGVLAFLLIGGGPASTEERLVLAAGKSTKPPYAAGVGLSSLIKFELLPTLKIDLQIVETEGAVDNARRLQSGDADLAILPSIVGHAARLGIGSFAGNPPETGFRAIATLWRDALHLVVHEDDVATGTIEDFLDLTDRKVSLGDASSGMVDANHLLLSDLGLDIDKTFDLTTIADGDSISAMKRGEIDGLSTAARPPQAPFDGVFGDAASGLRLLDVTESQMTRANGNHWLWTPYVIPAKTYPGQTEDVWTIGLSNILVVSADVSSETVYAITKSIFENLDYLQRVDPQMADLALDETLAGIAMPLHAGALRFYDEAGLIPKPASKGRARSPETAPDRQNQPQPPATTPDRYPGSDVAGEWPTGSGGPLLKAVLPDPGERLEQPASPPDVTPAPFRQQPEPHWRRRATL